MTNYVTHHFHYVTLSTKLAPPLYSSRYIFLRKRFGRVFIRQTLLPDELLLFEADHLPQTPHQPMATLPLYTKQLT